MKNPCELIIWYVLPDLRSEITKNLIETYSIKQTEAAEIFGVTRAAINQYLSEKRGSGLSSTVKSKKQLGQLQNEIKISANRIYKDHSLVNQELCRICRFIRTKKILNEIYMKHENYPAPKWLCDLDMSELDVTGANGGNCPHCKEEIQKTWKACPACGNKLITKCPNCTSNIEPNWIACPFCGKKTLK
jgi:predicted transcriptional regulator